MGFDAKSPDRIAQGEEEANIGVVSNEQRATTTATRTSLYRSHVVKKRNWWICLFVCSVLVVTGRVLSTLLLNFYFVQTGRDTCDDPKQFKGTWLQSMVQNAAFPSSALLLFLWRSLFSTKKQTLSSSSSSSSSSHTSYFKLFLLYIALGVLFAAYSQLYAIGRTRSAFFYLIFTAQLPFTSIFTKLINKHRFNRWMILSLGLSAFAASMASSDNAYHPCEAERSRMSEGAWCSFFGSVAFSLSLCIIQLGFQKIITNEESKVSKVLVIQTNASMIAVLICLVGLFASGEFKDIKEDYETFRQGKPLYVLGLIGLSLAWQVMSLGLVGLACLASSLFSNVVSFCVSPLAYFSVMLAFRFMDYEIEWRKGGALVAGILGFASSLYSLHKSIKRGQIASRR